MQYITSAFKMPLYINSIHRLRKRLILALQPFFSFGSNIPSCRGRSLQTACYQNGQKDGLPGKTMTPRQRWRYGRYRDIGELQREVKDRILEDKAMETEP